MKLLLLRCPVCQEGLHPEDNDVVLACTNCHSPIALDENGMDEANVHYAAATKLESVTHWLPFWITYGRVNITNRQTQGSNRGAQKDSQEMWETERYLYIPAWDMPIPEARQLGRTLVESQPVLVEGERPAVGTFTAANVTAEDALKLLELIILTIETERKDWLKDLKFTIQAPPPELWIVPAVVGRGVSLMAQTAR